MIVLVYCKVKPTPDCKGDGLPATLVAACGNGVGRDPRNPEKRVSKWKLVHKNKKNNHTQKVSLPINYLYFTFLSEISIIFSK